MTGSRIEKNRQQLQLQLINMQPLIMVFETCRAGGSSFTDERLKIRPMLFRHLRPFGEEDFLALRASFAQPSLLDRGLVALDYFADLLWRWESGELGKIRLMLSNKLCG